MDLNELSYVQAAGVTLNVEEKSCLSTSLLLLKDSQQLKRLFFWGKITGVQKDYYVAVGGSENVMVGGRTYFYSTNMSDWSPLPEIAGKEAEFAVAVRGRFMGDSAFEYTLDGEPEDRLDENGQGFGDTINEEKRLSATVRAIDADTSVVPRGAIFKGKMNEYKVNETFQGLTQSELGLINYYYHERPSTGLRARINKEHDPATDRFDVFDCLAYDVPEQGSWSCTKEKGGAYALLRSLKWPGYIAYHAPKSANFEASSGKATSYGGVYCGTGEMNFDVSFTV